MRLVEFAGPFGPDILEKLRLLRDMANNTMKADPQATIPPLPYEELAQILDQGGDLAMNYEVFDQIAQKLKSENSEDFEDVVSNYDEEGITLNTLGDQGDQDPNLTPNTSAGKSVDQMARNVVKKELS